MQSWIQSKHIVEMVLYASHNKYMSHIKLLQKNYYCGYFKQTDSAAQAGEERKVQFSISAPWTAPPVGLSAIEMSRKKKKPTPDLQIKTGVELQTQQTLHDI